ncbi:MAG: fluoride efflux transporter CrcB [Planctomycetes bacterium]|nr:fluoride efflux transporter CrcB [Planctomycetota bacterium]
MPTLLWVCLGGAVGSGARHLLCNWLARTPPQAFPVGTLLVNCTGSFLLAFLMAVSMGTAAVPPPLRVALGAGVLGGFTTYSTFSYETFVSLQDGDYGTAVGNIAATVAGCLAATALGWFAGRWLATS